MIEEAFERGGHCVVKQLTAHLQIPASALEEHLDVKHGDWCSEGVTTTDVLALAEAIGRSCYVLGENRLLLKHEETTRRKAICCMVALGHFHLYTNCKFAKEMVANAPEIKKENKEKIYEKKTCLMKCFSKTPPREQWTFPNGSNGKVNLKQVSIGLSTLRTQEKNFSKQNEFPRLYSKVSTMQSVSCITRAQQTILKELSIFTSCP